MAKKRDRQQFILHEVRTHSRVLLADLAHLLNVSMDTVRRDITELDEAKKLKKVHGGAISIGFHYSNDVNRDIYAFENKAIIAKKAVELIEPDSVILISGGTTNLELVKRLPAKLNATFFTPSLPVALELMQHENIEVIFIGGKLSRDAQITIGGSALNTLSEIKVDLCFLGTGYLDPANGLTEFDWEVVQMKKAMINASKKVISLTISEKLNSTQRYKICEIQSISGLITELDVTAEILTPYRDQNITVI
ncbi:DeoR/GlpR transcriptional regulator [Fulvivirga sp. M361]|uniref:DeoR/GlpR family DNA-binding transcription regulator n=1 Tax=Fulvivirga sp. M361 TaxID=2594266 RepID=UPI00117A1546|nr:DeoR/GlpR family DNA-binding transcription regulator [Fulvivirga sp. M361]TRX50934.1 DeoR/GlpR transcriptional regulator [Fulvivirga sp. M361]